VTDMLTIQLELMAILFLLVLIIAAIGLKP